MERKKLIRLLKDAQGVISARGVGEHLLNCQCIDCRVWGALGKAISQEIQDSVEENELDKNRKLAIGGKLQTCYDYQNQAWIVNGRYVRCNHPDDVDCQCYGKLHEGEEV